MMAKPCMEVEEELCCNMVVLANPLRAEKE